MDLVKVECIATFDPKIIRVTLLSNTGLQYAIDIPQPLYPDIGAPLGWPTDPCAGM